MKKVIIIFILVYMLILPSTALAQTNEAKAGLTPDSLFYWFDRLAERIILVFTFDSQEKVNALSKFGLERLAEANETDDKVIVGTLISEYLTDQNEIELKGRKDLDSLVTISEDRMGALTLLSIIAANNDGEVKNKASIAISYVIEKLKEHRIMISQLDINGNPQATSKAIVILDKIANKLADPTAIPAKGADEKADNVKAATSKHTEVLENNAGTAPEQAKPAIENAIDKSATGTEKAPQAISKPAPSSPPAPATPAAPAEKGKKK